MESNSGDESEDQDEQEDESEDMDEEEDVGTDGKGADVVAILNNEENGRW